MLPRHSSIELLNQDRLSYAVSRYNAVYLMLSLATMLSILCCLSLQCCLSYAVSRYLMLSLATMLSILCCLSLSYAVSRYNAVYLMLSLAILCCLSLQCCLSYAVSRCLLLQVCVPLLEFCVVPIVIPNQSSIITSSPANAPCQFLRQPILGCQMLANLFETPLPANSGADLIGKLRSCCVCQHRLAPFSTCSLYLHAGFLPSWPILVTAVSVCAVCACVFSALPVWACRWFKERLNHYRLRVMSQQHVSIISYLSLPTSCYI